MRIFLIIFSYSVYLVFLLGLFLHTSAHPQILGKYTYQYAAMLLVLVLFFPVLLLTLFYISKESTYKFKKKKLTVKPIQKLLILLFCFLLVAILPLEIYQRIKYRNFESTGYQYTLNNFDPFLQFKLTNDYTTNINSYGFRSKEITKNKPQGTYRIFILGGSTVLNRGTDFEKTSSVLLEKQLQKQYPSKKIEVINAGNDGYTSQHSLMQYLFKIKDFDPDMIIMWHGINDWYYSCSPPERAHGVFETDYSHFLGADAGMAFDHFRPKPLLSFELTTYDIFIKFMQDNWYSDIINSYKKNYPFDGYYTNETMHKQYVMKQVPSLESYKRNLKSLINATKDDEVALLLGNQPYLYSEDISRDEIRHIYIPILHCTKDGKYPNLQSVISTLNLFNTATESIAKDNAIPFVDLESAVPKSLDYFTDDVHYTDKGNKKIADTLYKAIDSSYKLDK